MSYFGFIEEKDEVYSVVYGLGTVNFIVEKRSRVDGFYTFEVLYKDGTKVFYTDDGVPNWCHTSADCQTVWYRDDIDLINSDISPSDDKLSKKKIAKLRMKDQLEMKCPSGIWRDIKGCPERVIIEALGSEKFHLFRKSSV